MAYNHQRAIELFQEFLARNQSKITAPMITAAEFAIDAHMGQCRKNADIPYVSHLFEVAEIMLVNNLGEDMVIAGLLHDVMEDTSKTSEDIEALFSPSKGREIVKIILADTENDKNMPWKERKLETINFLKKTKSKKGMLLICADKISNLRSFQRSLKCEGDSIWEKFNASKDEQHWYYETIGELLSNKLSEYKELNKEYKVLLKEIFD